MTALDVSYAFSFLAKALLFVVGAIVAVKIGRFLDENNWPSDGSH